MRPLRRYFFVRRFSLRVQRRSRGLRSRPVSTKGTAISGSLQRLVRSQILFREVNERVRETIGAFGGPIDFLCECSQEDCTESVELDMEEYERIRSDANLFVIVTGHEMLEVDRVVDQGNGYVLVEKIVAVDEVVAADPRSRGG